MKKIILIFILMIFLVSGCAKKDTIGAKIINPENYLDCENCIQNGFYWCKSENGKCIDTGRVITRYECEGELKGEVVSDLEKC